MVLPDVVERSLATIEVSHLRQLAEIARNDLQAYVSGAPRERSKFLQHVLCVVLCQGAALHYVDRRNGVKDFDVYTFFAKGNGRDFPVRRVGKADFGISRFGRHPREPEFEGRRVDLLGRSILHERGEEPSLSLQRYLRGTPTRTAWYLAQKAAVMLEPAPLCGTVVWPRQA